jgi:hypothetical protein
MIKLFTTHPYLASAIATWLFNNIVSALVSNLPAPTKDSSVRYVYWFKVTNSIIGNVRRAQSTTIEESPNWQAAVDAHVEKLANGSLTGAAPPAKEKP